MRTDVHRQPPSGGLIWRRPQRSGLTHRQATRHTRQKGRHRRRPRAAYLGPSAAPNAPQPGPVGEFAGQAVRRLVRHLPEHRGRAPGIVRAHAFGGSESGASRREEWDPVDRSGRHAGSRTIRCLGRPNRNGSSDRVTSPDLAPVPEPGTLLLVLVGSVPYLVRRSAVKASARKPGERLTSVSLSRDRSWSSARMDSPSTDG